MSVIAVVGGLVLLALFTPLLKLWDAAPRPEAKTIFEAIVEAFARLARDTTQTLHNGAFTQYAGILALTIVAVVVVDILFLRYAYISFFCLLAGLGTLHLIYIIARNKCARECPVLFA